MKKPLFISYSDIHHNIWAQYNEDNKRLKASFSFERKIFRRAQKYKCGILFMGDLLHLEKAISNELLSYLLPHYKGLSDYDVKWYGISGNHDQSGINLINNESPSYVKTICNTFKNFTCVDFKSLEYKNVKIHGIPYLTHDEGLLESINSIKRDKGYKHILMLHTTLPGTVDTNGRLIQTNSIGKDIMKKLYKFDLVLTGHIHKPLVLKKGKILQIGATNQQRKTDKDCELGYWIVYDDLSYEFVKVKSPKFIEIPEGQSIPDKFHYYYKALKERIAEINSITPNSEKYSDINNKSRIAKSYLKDRKIKDKNKKQALLEILKKVENDDI